MNKIPAKLSGRIRRPLLPLTFIFLSASIGAQAQQQTITPPAGSGAFGTSVTVLANGNYVVTDPFFDDGALTDVGAVHLYNGSTHALISTLKGNIANSQISNGGLFKLNNSNFLICSPAWSDGVSAKLGAVTFVNGTTGLNAVLSSTNSLVGSSTNDSVGRSSSITVLSNGNYVVSTFRWDNGSAANAGAATWGDGTTGISGVISSSNSIVGSKADDRVGGTVTDLTNGNYTVNSLYWDNGSLVDAGAVTWCNGNGSTTGIVSSSNSLVGSKANDNIGLYMTALTNGNYVVGSPYWDNGTIADAGAATWGNGTTGITGTINSSNSLIGTSASDQVASAGTDALTNGNYVVKSYQWKNGTAASAGAITWGNGTTGITGTISAANSLVGDKPFDNVGTIGVALPNGNYVACSHLWDAPGPVFDAGAITFFDGNGGTTGVISSSNSLVGSYSQDQVGFNRIVQLNNGNFVIATPKWNFGQSAVTWVNGATGITGTISSSNSLIGSGANQSPLLSGALRVIALDNGNYVITSPDWDNGSTANVGAVTWANGLTGITGTISSANSLTGTIANDLVGSGSIITYPNSNYVVASPRCRNGSITAAGAVTYCNGTTGTTGAVNSSNSLVGSNTSDSVGSGGLLALSNGNYVVASPNWRNGTITGAGAVTLCNASGTTIGAVSSCNSLVGNTASEKMGSVAPVALANGNYVTGTANWDNASTSNVGVRVVGDPGTPLTGTVNGCNSVQGTSGTGSSMTQVFNPVYNYTLVKNSTANSLVAFYGTTTNQTIANHLDASYAIACSNTSLPFTAKGGCRIVGSTVPGGASPVSGPINVKTWVESSILVYSGYPYVARHHEVAPVNNASTATEKVTLYFTQQEFTDYNNFPGSALDLPSAPGDAVGIANLRIGIYGGTSSTNTGYPVSYPGASSIVDPPDADIVWNPTQNWWEVSFDLTGSAGITILTTGIPLSLDLLEFNGKLNNGDALLNWKTENEHNTTGFNVERSNDGRKFTDIGFVSSNNRPGTNFYSFNDRNIDKLGITEIFYRLKQNDIDGHQKYSQVVRLSLENKNSVTLYPNPATMAATLSLSLAEADQLQLRIVDNTGRILLQKTVSVSSGITLLPLDLSKLASGFYYLEMQGKILNERKQFVKQ